MVLSDTAIRRPVFAVVVSLLLVVLGVFAFQRLTVREYPNIDPPIVSVSTAYEGASAQVIESQITQVIEEGVAGVAGIRTMRSTSQEGRSSVRLEFAIDRDVESATNDVRDSVGRVIGQLPDNADTPIIRKVDSDASPIIYATLTSEGRSALELTDLAQRYVVDPLSAVSGVAQVTIGGEREPSMRIWLDRNAMAARGVTVQDVSSALEAQNVELPSGRVESSDRELTVRTNTRLSTPPEFARIVLRREGETLVRLGDVARVEVGARDDRSGFRVDGRPAIGVGVVKQSTANTLDVAADVRQAMDTLRQSLPPDVQIEISSDDSVFIDKSIDEVFITLGIALALVIGIVFIFLRSVRATLIPAVAVPVSITASFIILAALGYSINVLTLLAMVLAIGLVVDDAIIVLENISRRIELGEPPLVAAYLGSRQIGFAVVATTAVLTAVFVPISFLQGNVGRLFSEFGITVASSVLFSALVALTLTPAMCSRLLRPANEETWLHKVTEHGFDLLNRGYRAALGFALGAPVLVCAIALALSVGAAALLHGLPQEFVPTEDRGRVVVSATGPEGSSIDYTGAQLARIESALSPYVAAQDVTRLLSILAPGWGPTGVNRVTVIGQMKPWDERTRSQQQVVRELSAKLSDIPGIRAVGINPSGLARGSGAPVRFVIGGNTYEQLAAWRDQLQDRLRGSPVLRNLQADYDETKPELRVAIDRDRAADLGISIRAIGETLETMFGSVAVTRYEDDGEEYDVVLQARAEDRQTPRDLSNIFVRASGGTLVPLTSLVKLQDVAGPASLGRFDRVRAITFTASLADGATLGDAVTEVRVAVADTLPAEARLSWDGDTREFLESSASLYITFGTALLIVFLVLAAQFESFVHPVTILLTVPLAIFGALGSVALLGMTVNIYTQIGMVMLIGLTAKNAILIVEFANQLRDEGRDVLAAVHEASATRLRPILMTSIATALGALPLAIATGAGAESRQAIGVVIFGGVMVSTLLSLFLVPVIYQALARFTAPASRTSKELERQLLVHRSENPAAE
ncbi:multidrug efflux pump [Inquilinus ginsengisoli]|uniref:Multidrug efflux pump n=1 Tax=Inquilinus ginsengisoli TaxID=363840 RepID=A0ABU1JU64_9PROT|nr:efflux RND transporter permease subunit [Inquilinus ginsengisoli]MDR6292165.1 multidrug efflux pump [Inquilinus ginsengisoli]